MLLNDKSNDAAQKMLWAEVVHTCECVQNSMAITNRQKTPFDILWRKLKRIGLFYEFGRIAYVTNREKISGEIKDKKFKTFKEKMV